MWSKEERKWFRKNREEIWEKCKTANPPEELELAIINSYRKQSEEIRRDIRNYMRMMWEKGDDGNWQEDAMAALQLMGIECKIVSKRKKK